MTFPPWVLSGKGFKEKKGERESYRTVAGVFDVRDLALRGK